MTLEQLEYLKDQTPYVGLSCVKDHNNFYFTSNYALFSMDAAETDEEAQVILEADAKKYAALGYTIEWSRDEVQ